MSALAVSGAERPTRVQQLQEKRARFQGRHSLKTLNERGLIELKAAIVERYRIDPEKVLEESYDPRFSWKTWERNYREALRKSRLSEAQTASAQSQVLRYGITRLAGEGYELEPSVYENEIAEVVPSKGFENYYTPFFRPGRGGPVERGQAYPAVKMSGLNVTIRNYRFGSILEIEEDLIDDDQSGEIVQQGAQIGESLSYEVDMFGFQQMLAATWVNYLAGGGAMTTPNVNVAHNALRKVHDPNGNLIVTRPDTLLVDTDDEIVARQVLDSMVAANNPGASPAAGSVIYFGTMNPLRGLYNLVATPWLSEANKTAANPNGYGTDGVTQPKWLLRAKRRIIMQTRKPLQVVQEAENAGTGFNEDVLRWKGKMRFGAGPVDTRYAYRIN